MFDPLVHAHPPAEHSHTRSYWAATISGDTGAADAPLTGDHTCEVAIVGAGYTGLSTALHLARDHGLGAVVVEAGPVAWGCSGRNGSFARASGGRLGLATAARRYGLDVAKDLFREMQAGLDTVRGLIDGLGLDCDRQPDGVLKVAHRPRLTDGLRDEATFFQSQLGYPAQFLSPGAAAEQGHPGPENHGALYYPDGFAMHPLKLAHGYLAAARAHGARVHPSSPVIRWEPLPDGRHCLHLPAGRLTCRQLVVATNGYGGEVVFPFLKARLMPALSEIIVTRPLTGDEIHASGISPTHCMMDTRSLLHYYRRLPDDRILFGGRGAISGAEAGHPRYVERLRRALIAKFPALDQISVDYHWAGWVAITADHLPHVYTLTDHGELVHVAAGYSGSGVSFATLAGKRLAELVTGQRPAVPVAPVSRPLPAFFPAALRRTGQRLFYAGWRARDERA